MGLGSPSPRSFHMVSLSFWPRRVGMGQPLLFLFLLAGKRPNQHIWEIRVDYRRNLPNVGIEVLEGIMGARSPSLWEGSAP